MLRAWTVQLAASGIALCLFSWQPWHEFEFKGLTLMRTNVKIRQLKRFFLRFFKRPGFFFFCTPPCPDAGCYRSMWLAAERQLDKIAFQVVVSDGDCHNTLQT
jgi:hypothetical protein